jgi:hypothetical protein
VATGSGGDGGYDGFAPAEHPGRAAALTGRVARGWRAWRHWRRTRPFWGGLLVILGGAEILLSEKGPLPLIIHIGLQGLAGYLIPTIMVLCGLLLLFHPVQRTFYSLLAVLLALGSWITSNLGGFFVGMLLGLVGGSLAFAWQHRDQPGPGKRRRRPRVQPGLIAEHGEPEQEKPEGGWHSGTAKVGPGIGPLAPVASLALSMLVAPAPPGPVPLAQPPAAAAVGLSPRPASTHAPGATRPPSPGQTVAPTARPTPSPSVPAKPSPRPPRKHVRHLAIADAPMSFASTAQSNLTAVSAVLAGLSFDGIAYVRTAAGEVLMLKLSMDSLTLTGTTLLLVRQDGHTFVANDYSLGFTGQVVLYTTKISGDLRGARVTFDPEQLPPRLPPDLALMNVVADQPYIIADSLQASGFQTTEGSSV